MYVFITGGAGYIGNELILSLLKMKEVESIVVYDNLSRKNYNLFLDKRLDLKKIKFVGGELLDTKTLQSYIKKSDIVFHLAGVDSLLYSNDNPYPFDQVNNWGTAEMVYAVESCSNVKKFFYLSTTDVYGKQISYIDDTGDTFPETHFAKSKLNGENHIKRIKDHCQTFILRTSDVYGYSPSAKFDSLINKFIFEVNFMGRIHIHGNGKQERDFIHVNHVVKVLKGLLLSDSLSPGTYNLVGRNFSVEDIAYALKEVYPQVNKVYLHQHESFPNRSVERNPVFDQYLNEDITSLKEEVIEFKERFSFFRSKEPTLSMNA